MSPIGQFVVAAAVLWGLAAAVIVGLFLLVTRHPRQLPVAADGVIRLVGNVYRPADHASLERRSSPVSRGQVELAPQALVWRSQSGEVWTMPYPQLGMLASRGRARPPLPAWVDLDVPGRGVWRFVMSDRFIGPAAGITHGAHQGAVTSLAAAELLRRGVIDRRS
jgi:hypothetical protein